MNEFLPLCVVGVAARAPTFARRSFLGWKSRIHVTSDWLSLERAAWHLRTKRMRRERAWARQVAATGRPRNDEVSDEPFSPNDGLHDDCNDPAATCRKYLHGNAPIDAIERWNGLNEWGEAVFWMHFQDQTDGV